MMLNLSTNRERESTNPRKSFNIFSTKYLALVFCTVFLFFGMTTKASATTYYVDNTCFNNGDGSSQTCAVSPGSTGPFNSIATVNNLACGANSGQLNAGDNVELKSGDIFREQLTIPCSGSAGNLITFGSYGNGSNPLLNGSSPLNNVSFSPYYLPGRSTLFSMIPTNNVADGGNRNYRQVFTAAASSTTIQISLQASDSTNWVIAGASIGLQSSASAATSLTRITWSGSNGVTITAGATATSDVINFPVVSGQNYLVHVYMTARGMKYASSGSNITNWYDGSGVDETLTLSPSGMTSQQGVYFVKSVTGDGKKVYSTTVLPTYSVNSVTLNGTTATLTTSSPHELISGQYVTIVGANPAGYNGTFQITVTSPTTFTYTVSSGLSSPATGTITYTMVTPIQVWEDHKFLQHQSSISAVATAGSWYWDGTTLYINGWNQDDPTTNGRTYEVAHLAYGIFDNSNNYLEIKNIDAVQTYGSADANGNYTANAMSGIYLQGSNSKVHDLSVYNTWRHGFSFYVGSTNNLAYNLTVHDNCNTTDVAIYGTGTTNNTLENSTIYNSQGLCGNQPLVVIHGTAHGNILQYNDFYNTVGNAPDLISVGNEAGTDGNIIRYNHIRFLSSGSENGIVLNEVSDTAIYGNLFEWQNSGFGAIQISGGSGDKIYNNTIIGNPTLLSYDYQIVFDNHQNINIKNNLITGAYAMAVNTDSQSTFVSDHNLFYNPGGIKWTLGSNNYTSISDWKTNSLQDSNSLSVDPKFTVAGSNFSLQSSSPAIDVGFSLGDTYKFGLNPNSIWPGSVNTLDQTQNGLGWDIGAYVYTQSTAPTISITAPSTGTMNGSVTLTATAGATSPATVSQVQFQLDGVNLGTPITSSPYTMSWDTSTTSNASHTLTAIATDNYTNTTTSAPVTVTVDNAAPTITPVSPTGTLSWGTTSTTLSVTTNKNATCKYDTSSKSYASMANTFTTTGGTTHSSTLTGLTYNHTYTDYIRCQDTLGNTNLTDTTITFSLAADTTPPTVSITAPVTGNVKGSVIITATASAPSPATLSSVQFLLDGANLNSLITVSPYTTTWDTASSTTDGTHTLSAIATDDSNNTATASGVTVIVDNTPPTTSASPASGTYGPSQTITLSCLDVTSGCNHIYYTTDNSTPSTSSSTYSTPISLTSSFPLKFFSTDLAGNSESPKTENYILNTSLPVITLISPTTTLSANTVATTLSVTTDKTATCAYSTTAGTSYSSMTPFTSTNSTTHTSTISNLQNGNSYTYYIKCQDSYGNTNIDDFPISFSIQSPNSGTHGGGRLIPNYVVPIATNPTTTPIRTIYNFGPTTLKNGSKGEAVKELQRFLNNRLNLGLIIDGKLGPKTIAVIKKWQKANGLIPDGLVGAKTKAKMNAVGN